ncbi:MAG: pseudaminic acid biosynthesis-associated methylase, partial [Steroidobacteraceae bacterium]
MSYKTDQEAFWAGEFGTRYITRNASSGLLAANLSFFSRALRRTAALRSCLEFGANIGMNLRALKLLYPDMTQAAVEINAEAAKNLGEFIGERQVFCGSMLDFQVTERFDLVLIKGV